MFPALFMLISYLLRDNIFFYCLPVLIANLIFGAIMAVLSLYVVIYTVMISSSDMIRAAHIAHVGVLFFCILLN